MPEMQVQLLGGEDPLEEVKATHSSIPAWRMLCSLVGYSPWGRKELDTTERLHFHFSLSCIGEGNGNPLQCSCPENSRDGGAWWAPVYHPVARRKVSSLFGKCKAQIPSCPQAQVIHTVCPLGIFQTHLRLCSGGEGRVSQVVI